MNKLKIKQYLLVLAIVAGTATAMAFHSEPVQETAWFEVNAQTGQPVGQALSSEPACNPNDAVHCSARYNIDAQGNPVGTPLESKMGQFIGL